MNDYRAVELLRPLGQGPGDLQHDGHARGVVVGPVIDRPALGRQRAMGTVAQVIVMGAQHDRLVGQRPFAGQDGGDILHFAVDVPHVGLALNPPALEFAAGRLERAVDLVFDLAQLRFVQIAENAVDHRPATIDHRQVGVGERGAGDVERAAACRLCRGGGGLRPGRCKRSPRPRRARRRWMPCGGRPCRRFP